MPLLDLIKFSSELAARRNKAALLLTPDVREQHNLAARLANTLSVPHLDVLDRFRADTELTEQIAGFAPTDFFKLVGKEKSAPLLVISGIEFLLASWIAQSDAKQVKRNFCQQIELWSQKPAFLLVAQQDSIFAEYLPTRHTGSPIIIQLSQTLALT
jgi:hypothetical protein